MFAAIKQARLFKLCKNTCYSLWTFHMTAVKHCCCTKWIICDVNCSKTLNNNILHTSRQLFQSINKSNQSCIRHDVASENQWKKSVSSSCILLINPFSMNTSSAWLTNDFSNLSNTFHIVTIRLKTLSKLNVSLHIFQTNWLRHTSHIKKLLITVISVIYWHNVLVKS